MRNRTSDLRIPRSDTLPLSYKDSTSKLLIVFPKSLQYLAHCLGKGGAENQITTAEICDW